jgi:hypothetical protein
MPAIVLELYDESMRSIASIARAIRRKLTPPGNRGSLDTEFRQPNGGSGGSTGTGLQSGNRQG